MNERQPSPSSIAISEATAQELTIGQYLIRRLEDYGLEDLFGIPGDYVLTLYGMLEKSSINVVGCTREDCAGFAADAYARLNGLGAVCVTYCVGGLSVCNAIAGAYAEKSPVVLITGSPGLHERINNPLLHHKVRDFHTQMEVFERLCVAGSELSDPFTAFQEIDRVLEAATRLKRPVYLDIPRDMVNVVPQSSYRSPPPSQGLNADDALGEAVAEAAELLNRAKKPMIIAGVEIHRFGLQDDLLGLAEASQLPIAATILGKSVIRETHPLYIGLYEGSIGYDSITKYVEESDCLLLLGTFMTDLNLGIYTANLDPGRCIYATSEALRIHHHHYHGVQLGDFIRELTKVPLKSSERPVLPSVRDDQPFESRPDEPIRIDRVIKQLNLLLDDDTIVIADIGDSLFAATELKTHERTDFISPAYYTSMGFSVPAALGAQVARPDHRVLVICGDGAFQMTGMELSTIVRHGFAPIVIVLDNHGYGTERILHPGEWEYNEIHPWNYSRLPEVLNGGTGYVARTEGEFAEAINKAWSDRGGMSLIQTHIAADDCSETLTRLAEKLGKRVAGHSE